MGLLDIFNKEKREQNKREFEGLIDGFNKFIIIKDVQESLAKGASLKSLGRTQEAKEKYTNAIKTVLTALKSDQHSFELKALLADIYIEIGDKQKARKWIEFILEHHQEQDRQILMHYRAILSKYDKNIPIEKKQWDSDKNKYFTQIYVCPFCGRLINYVTKPCIFCESSSETREELMGCLLLSSANTPIPDLLFISRRFKECNSILDVVPNLNDQINNLINNEPYSDILNEWEPLINNLDGEGSFSLNKIACRSCGKRVFASFTKECSGCGNPIHLNETEQLILSLNSVLSLIEDRLEPTENEYFIELICVCIYCLNILIHTRKDLERSLRHYLLHIIKNVGVLIDKDKAGFVETHDKLKINLVQGMYDEDTESYVMYLFHELTFLTEHLNS